MLVVVGGSKIVIVIAKSLVFPQYSYPRKLGKSTVVLKSELVPSFIDDLSIRYSSLRKIQGVLPFCSPVLYKSSRNPKRSSSLTQ